MVQFSKVWCRFTTAGMILVLIFTAGMTGLLAQTVQDSVVDGNKPSKTRFP